MRRRPNVRQRLLEWTMPPLFSGIPWAKRAVRFDEPPAATVGCRARQNKPERDRDTHPAVVFSVDEVCADSRQLRVNVLFGTKRVPGAVPRAWGALLNSADGLEFQTEFDCGFIHVVAKEKIVESVGRVSLERRRLIMRKVSESFRMRF